MSDLKLIALDAEDLAVLSAHLQDATVRVGDMAYLKDGRRFAAIANRFDWERALSATAQRRPFVRRRVALRFERVTGARLSGIDLTRKDDVLSLLALSFAETEAPAGSVTLQFSGGGAIRLDVECVEAELRDLGAQWAARKKPEHGDGGPDKPKR